MAVARKPAAVTKIADKMQSGWICAHVNTHWAECCWELIKDCLLLVIQEVQRMFRGNKGMNDPLELEPLRLSRR